MLFYLVQCSFSAAADRAAVDTTADDTLEDNVVAAGDGGSAVAAAVDGDVIVDNTAGAEGNLNSRHFLSTLDSKSFVAIPQALICPDSAVVGDLCGAMHEEFHSTVK